MKNPPFQIPCSDNDQKALISTIYAASPSGIFKLYPGYNITHNFEPTVRPWYIKAIQSDAIEAITYVDQIWDTLIVTLTKAVKVENEVKIVVAVDMNVRLISQLVENMHPNCANDDDAVFYRTCTLLYHIYGKFLVGKLTFTL